MREVQVVARCDRCGNQISDGEDFDLSVQLDVIEINQIKYVADLCATCKSWMLAEFDFLEKLPHWLLTGEEVNKEQRQGARVVAGKSPQLRDMGEAGYKKSEQVSCHICGKVFTQRGMHIHTAAAHGDGAFPCDFCGKVWPTRQTRATHERTGHEDLWMERAAQQRTPMVNHPVPEE